MKNPEIVLRTLKAALPVTLLLCYILGYELNPVWHEVGVGAGFFLWLAATGLNWFLKGKFEW